MKLKKICLTVSAVLMLLMGFSGVNSASAATDTLKLTIKQAEDRFLQKNLQLIAQRYNIDNASAQIITARLFQNPDFSFGNGIYANDETEGPAYKEHTFSISQLFTTAGKRNKNIRLAKAGVVQAQYQFFDLLRTLKFTLRSDFYTIYFQKRSAAVYDEEISSLAQTLTVYKQELTKGYISEKEVLRIQAQLYSLQSEYNSLLIGIDTVESEFRLMIKAPVDQVIDPQVNGDFYGKTTVAETPYARLLDSAFNNRYDLRYARATVDYNNINLDLQKANAVPDVSLSLNYDRLGGYGNNFLGAGIEFNLPFFNRNQGNIKQARIAVDQSKVQLESQHDQVESDVATAYKGALRFETLYNSFDPKFQGDFEHMAREVLENYKKRNIGLLDFLDFYDSYKTNTLQMNSIMLNRVTSLEQLNYVTGTPFFNQP